MVVYMWKKSLVFLILIFCGCQNVNIKNSENVSINYPVTGLSVLDNEISSYINRIYGKFTREKDSNSKLNISYKYRDLNDDIINVSLECEIDTGEIFHIIKTYTYNRKKGAFLSIEDLVRDVDELDLEIKRKLLEKYEDINFEYLNSVDMNNYTIDDENITLFFNSNIVRGNEKIVYLDIPLNSLDMMVDIKDNLYFSIKRRNVDLDDKVVALTFDDGPSKYTSGILDILKKQDACATFFVVGSKAYFQGDILRRTLKEGSEIGNHSFSHSKLTGLSKDEFKNEVDKTQGVIKDLTGFTPTLFRPTYGGYTNRLKGYTDLKFVLWDVDSRDWQVKKKDRIIGNVLPYVKSGSIVLFHDNHDYALNAIEDIIISLKDKGYKFVTVSELLELVKMRENS